MKSPERGAKRRKTSSGQKKLWSMTSNYLLITFFSMLSVSFVSVYMYPYLDQRITAISIIGNLNHVRKSTLTEILRIVDSNGNDYYKVGNLSEDTIYRPIIDPEGRDPNIKAIIKPTPVPRRFITEKSLERTFVVLLIFLN